MSLNIAALKAKLNQFTKQTNRDDAIWKPTEGKTVVRIVPWKDNRENPFIELYFHYLGNKTYLSPTSHGNRDPILEFAEKISEGGDKESWAQARIFRPKLRTYVPVLVRGEEEKGVRFYSFGKTVYQELLSIISDPDYGDITDVKNGRDVVVEYIPQEKSDTNFAKTMVRPKPNQTPISDSAEKIQKFLNEQPDIRSLFKEPSYAELSSVLAAYLGADEETTDVDEPAPQAAKPSQSATTSRSNEVKSSSSVKDMIDDFDQVFN